MPTSLLPNPANVRINPVLPDPANIRIVKENLPNPINIRIVSPIPQPLPEPTEQEKLAKESNDYGFNLLTGTASEAGKEAYSLAKKTFSPFDIRNVTNPIAEVLSREVMSGKPPIQAYKDMGKGVARAGYDTLQGLSHAVGDPLGTTDIASGDLTFPTARQAWREQPYESVVGVSPILAPLLMKGIGSIPRRQQEIKISPEAKQAYTSGIQEIGQTLKNIPDQARPAQARVVADLRNQMRSALFKDDVATINSIVADFREGQTIPTAQPSKPTLRIPSQVEIPSKIKEVVQPITRPPRDLLAEQQQIVETIQPLPKPENVEIVKPQPKGFTPIEAAPVYKPRGLKEAITIRKEMGSLAGYDLQSQTEWLGGQKPKDEITIYRATPTGEEIKPGDYVTNSLEYVKQHIQNNLGGKGIITKAKATLDDIFPADAPKEFWYAPKSIELQQTHTMPSGEVMPGAEHAAGIPSPAMQDELLQVAQTENIFKQVKGITSAIKIDKGFFDHFDRSEVRPIAQKSPGLFSTKQGMPLDEVADGLGISTDELASKLRDAVSKKEKTELLKKQIQEYRPPTPQVIVGELGLKIGDKFKIHGEQYTVKERDAEGHLVIKNGDTYTVDEFDSIPQPDEGSLQTGKAKYTQPKMFEGEKTNIVPKMEADIQGQQKLFNPKGEIELHAGLPIPSIIKSFARLPGIEKIVGFFDPLKGLSPEANIAYQNIRNKEKGREARVQQFVMNQFDRLSAMPTEIREQMFHALTSRESITKLPKEYWRKAESLRSLHKYMGQMAVKRGLLSPETYAASNGEWVKHIYEKYMEEKKESLNKQQSSMTMQLDWRKRKLPDTSFGVDEQRARGLKEDVATAVPVGMTEVLTDLARSDMFDEILKNPELTWQPSVVSVDNGQGGLETWSIGNLQKHIESQGQAVLRNPGNVAMKNELARLQGIMEQAQKESGNAPKGYTQLPSTPAYGKLAGAYVKDAVARDIMPALAMFGKGTSESAFYNAVQKVMTKGMAIFKASKVALNLPSWFRNGGADVIMFNMKGTPLYEIPYWLEQSAVNMMKGTPEYTQAFRQGLFRTKYSDIEINNFLGTSRKLLGQDYSGITETLSGAANLYGKIDDWFKFAIYLEERSKGADVSTAVRQANKWGMDYSLVNPAVKIARQSLVPFASFNYKFVPLFAETAAQRPWIMAKYMAIPLIMLKAVQSKYDMTDEDIRKLVLSLPSYVRKQKTLLPLPHMSPEGNLEWVDIGYFLPWNTEIQAYKAIKEKDMGGMLRTIGVGNPFLDIYALAKSGHQGNPPRNPYNGQEIYNRLDDLPTKLFKLLEYNYNLFAPGMATRYGAAGKIAEIGKKDKYGRTVTPLQAMLRFIGVNIIAPSKEQGRIEKIAKIKELQASLYKGFRDSKGDKNKQKQLRESFKEKRRKILAGED